MPGSAAQLHDTNVRAKDFERLLEDFRKRVVGVDAVELVTTDGILIAIDGADQVAGEKGAAMAAGLHSLACAVGPAFKNRGPSVLKQMFFEADDDTLFFTMRAAQGTLIAVLAVAGADPGLIAHEMKALVQSVSAHLATPTRNNVAPLPVGGER